MVETSLRLQGFNIFWNYRKMGCFKTICTQETETSCEAAEGSSTTETNSATIRTAKSPPQTTKPQRNSHGDPSIMTLTNYFVFSRWTLCNTLGPNEACSRKEASLGWAKKRFISNRFISPAFSHPCRHRIPVEINRF